MPANNIIKMRRGTASQWASANPVMAAGEMGFESDTRKFKFGDATSAWNIMPYASAGGVEAGGFFVAETAPVGANIGDIWYNISDTGAEGGKSFIYYEGYWVELNPGTLGPQGSTGATGPANTLTVGTVTTLAAGELATIGITGTAPNQTVNFGIPNGADGATGDIGIITSASAPANTEVLWVDTSEAGDAVLPLAGTTGQVLSKVDGTDYNTTWTDASYVPAVGTDDQILTVVSGAPAWADAAGGGGLTLLSTTTLSGASTSIGSISQDYAYLVVEFYGLTMTAADDIIFQFKTGGTSLTNNSAIGARGIGTSASVAVNTSNRHNLAGYGIGDTNNYTRMTIYNYASTNNAQKVALILQTLIDSSARQNEGIQSFGFYNSTTGGIDEVGLATAAGTFNGGTLNVYGGM